ncbi:MAG: class I mannose-6-phosphate isomerase [Phycisphaerales bacterium]|nr:class I mannose-6-phosphate isomerase [Phycisphaerales bacterium]
MSNPPPHAPPHILILEPILMEKIWGGRRMASLGKNLPPDKRIGESWEFADLGATSASGGGGGSARSTIAAGPLKGRTLHEALQMWGSQLTGDISLTPDGNLPLLVKFLDARENLSVQVHPSPAYANRHPECHLKTECWLILDAEPGSVIYKGIKPGVNRGAFERHIAAGTVVGDLVAVPAIVGECHNLPSGTCHALGAGVLVAEVQTPSDTTFRVFDWGRTGRELHIEQSLECIDFGPAPAATSLPPGSARGLLVKTEFFEVERIRSANPIPAGPGMSTWMILDGRARIESGRDADAIDAARGATLVVPAACAEAATLVPEGMMDVLRITQ